MKKFCKIIREYPIAAALCVIADMIVTDRFTRISLAEDPIAMTYFIALYGTIMGVLIFTAGWIRAKSKAEKKEAELRRNIRRHEINAVYSREFYGITENL